MANNRISEIVADFAQKVATFAVQAQEAASARKVANALKGVAAAIGDGTVDIGDAITNGSQFLEAAELLLLSESDLTDTTTELVKSAKTVEVFIENEVLEGDEADIAAQAVALWQEVRPSGRVVMAQRGQNTEGRQSVADFAFPIYATCELCGDTIKTGERSGLTDWNSLRHYSQRHAQNVHASVKFDTFVTNAWRQAKAAFEAGSTEMFVEGDTSAPGFLLQKQEMVA